MELREGPQVVRAQAFALLLWFLFGEGGMALFCEWEGVGQPASSNLLHTLYLL